MPEHTTCQTSLERLEEVVDKLTQSQTTLTQNHQSLSQAHNTLNNKLDWMLDRLVAFTSTPPSPKPPSSSPLQTTRETRRTAFLKYHNSSTTSAFPSPRDSLLLPFTWKAPPYTGSSGCRGTGSWLLGPPCSRHWSLTLPHPITMIHTTLYSNCSNATSWMTISQNLKSSQTGLWSLLPHFYWTALFPTSLWNFVEKCRSCSQMSLPQVVALAKL